MFGWELPPHNSGGLGVACYGLSKALAEKEQQILFVLPKKVELDIKFLKVLYADSDNITFQAMNTLLTPYITAEGYIHARRMNKDPRYGDTLFEEVERFTREAGLIAQEQDFDVIHAHDWLSFGAGVEAKSATGKPLVVHVHSTEYDRTGGQAMNKKVFELERKGMMKADKVITVSHFTKRIVADKYSIPEHKISVVHNRINADEYKNETNPEDAVFQVKKGGKKIVLFVGRITMQKGPDYFIKVAKRVLEYEKDVLFVMAGSGDMEHQVMDDAAVMGISDKVLFTGFLRGKELNHIFRMADLFVMPSISEPFSITTLESILQDTPVLISKQSGVSEVLTHALKVDFWDIDEMTNKIISVLQHSSLQGSLLENSKAEVKKFAWEDAADECIKIYKELLTNKQESISNKQ